MREETNPVREETKKIYKTSATTLGEKKKAEEKKEGIWTTTRKETKTNDDINMNEHQDSKPHNMNV